MTIIQTQGQADDVIRASGQLNTLKSIWDETRLCNCTLTSVGIAIALSYLKIKVGVEFDLGIWIK